MIDPFVFVLLSRALLSCFGLGPSFVLEMVTTRAMSRKLRKGGSAPSLSPGSIGSDQTPVRVELETALRVEATSFLPAPALSFLPGDFGSIIPEDAPTAPPFGPEPRPMSSEAIPRPRRLGGDPRLKAAMGRVLARIDGLSTPSAGIFKARPSPFTTSAVMAVLHKVDHDLRRMEQGRGYLDEAASSNAGARPRDFSGLNLGEGPQETRPQSGQTLDGSFPSLIGPPSVSRSMEIDPDYTPDDRDPSTLPPMSVRETERYAYMEDDFDAYLGKTMATTTFFPTVSSESCTLQIFVSGPWTHTVSGSFATIALYLPPDANLETLHDRLDPISAIDRRDRVISGANGLPFHPLTPLSSQGVVSQCGLHVRGRLRGGSSRGNDGAVPENPLEGTPTQQGASDGGRTPGRGSPLSAFMTRRSMGAPSAIRPSPILSGPRSVLRSPRDGDALLVPDPPTMSGLIATGEHARAAGGLEIDPRLLLEDSSFHHRIAQRQRNPRRRDSAYALAFQQPNFGAERDGPAVFPDDHGSSDHPDRSVGDISSLRNRSGVVASSLGESNRILLRKAITLPSFSGLTRDWVSWQLAAERYFSVHQLGHVLLVGYLQSPSFNFEDNKLVYFILEMSISKSAKALSLFRRAPRLNGNAGYLHLYDGYTLSGIAAAPLLLQRLTSFKFQPNEDVFSFVLRLTDLFDELGRLPGAAACEFTDNQKVHYLLSAIRHEKSLAFMYENLQTQQSRGTLTFDLACDDLQLRYEALKSDELLSVTPRHQAALVAVEPVPVTSDTSIPALISTEHKKLNVQSTEYSLCLAEGCSMRERTPLCRLHYAELVCGKTPAMPLRDNLGTVTYNSKEHKAVYPASVSEERRKTQPRGPKAGPRRQ